MVVHKNVAVENITYHILTDLNNICSVLSYNLTTTS